MNERENLAMKKRGIKDESQVLHPEDLVNKAPPFTEAGKRGAKSDLGGGGGRLGKQ